MNRLRELRLGRHERRVVRRLGGRLLATVHQQPFAHHRDRRRHVSLIRRLPVHRESRSVQSI
jgi:hypothetical protein